MASVNFDAVLIDRRPPDDPRAQAVIRWAARLSELGMTPSYGDGDHGNLSCRTDAGVLISATSTTKSRLTAEELVEILEIDPRAAPARVRCRGLRTPSSDTLMHHAIYRTRPDVQAIIHGHDAKALASAGALTLRVTRAPAVSTTPALIAEVCELVRDEDYVLLRDHGFLALGVSLDAAGELLQRVNRDAASR